MHSSAWYNLGLLLRDEGPMASREVADCFKAASVIKGMEFISSLFFIYKHTMFYFISL
ncbi:hypothetical protein Hanom_Chr02g00171711 [Helianthus anomalus]